MMDPWKDPQAEPYIRLENISQRYHHRQIVEHLSLSIYRGEFFSLLGESGCGKTTLLRLIGGFETPSSGRIFIDGQDVTDLPPNQRPVNMMFQSYGLFPHLTVWQNVAFGLKQEALPKEYIQRKVPDVLRLVHMDHCAHRKPHELSGGQKQRVALARALVKQPKVLLLDEPLTALDQKLREKTQIELVNIQEQVGITFVMVTHDQEEAMTMSTRMGIMNQGHIEQVGTPGEIYEYPASTTVAKFIGSMNIFEGVVQHTQGKDMVVQCPDLSQDLQVPYSGSTPEGAHVWVAIRPEKVMIATTPLQCANLMQGCVSEIMYLGDVSIYHITLPSKKVVMATVPNLVRLAERPITWDDQVYVGWDQKNSSLLTA